MTHPLAPQKADSQSSPELLAVLMDSEPAPSMLSQGSEMVPQVILRQVVGDPHSENS